jgi:hypothetical protein
VKGEPVIRQAIAQEISFLSNSLIPHPPSSLDFPRCPSLNPHMNDDSLYLRLSDKLMNSYRFEPWPEAAWQRMLTSHDILLAKEELAAQERPWQKGIESAIERWLSTGRWPILTDIQSYFVSCRIHAAADFLRDLATAEAILAPSQTTEQNMLRFLLVEWWENYGRFHFLVARSAEMSWKK